jgi:pepF/M3 family oligoendopeptidase
MDNTDTDPTRWSDPTEPPVWELESVCPGGPGGAAFRERLEAVRDRLGAIQRTVEHGPTLEVDAGFWAVVWLGLEALADELHELSTFAGCHGATDSRSAEARAAEAAVDDLRQLRDEIGVFATAAVDAATDEVVATFLARPELDAVRPRLERLRQSRHLRLPPALEALKVATDREGLTGWGRLYDLLSGSLTGALHTAKGTRTVGVAELLAMRAEPDPALRRAANEARDAAWGSVRDVCAHTLTQITGNRLQHNDRLGVDELAFTLEDNRVSRATLDAMWSAADAARPALVRYLRHKATLLGTDGLAWHDVEAPLPGIGSNALSWGDATRMIGGAFRTFSPELAGFAREALDHQWIDARARDGRRPGGFCAGLPRSDASRIFLTWSGTVDNAVTLAHELGHAWHNRVLAGQPPARTAITSATAETASTFAEAVFRGQLLANAPDAGFRAFVLEQELSAAVAFLMNIPHRFQLERRLYELRREGVLNADQLDAETLRIQRACHGDALTSWDQRFWSNKLHFFIPEFGFYNWPYAFGYLFSRALYQRAGQEGPAFVGVLRDLLVRTGWQGTEELAHHTLGVDLTDPAFWRAVVAPLDGLCEDFVRSTTPA